MAREIVAVIDRLEALSKRDAEDITFGRKPRETERIRTISVLEKHLKHILNVFFRRPTTRQTPEPTFALTKRAL